MYTFSMPRQALLVVAIFGLLLALMGVSSWASETDFPTDAKPALGKPVAGMSITVFPDGAGLPAGQGSVAAGADLYQQHCLACHGPDGRQGINDALAGGQVAPHALPQSRTVGSYWPHATSLFDYVRRAMPYRQPGSLTDPEVYALVAYILHLNDLVAADTTLDAAQLRAIELPNRLRFFSTYELP
ncbi:MAG: cytochrome c [Pseudomonadota bacterium]